MRADLYLSTHGYAESRTAAKTLIDGGCVFNGEKEIKKPSEDIIEGSEIKVNDNREFVSRGGYKLKGALDSFKIDVKGKTAIDIGASSGGFTDCLLKRGAEFVYAVDCGSNQLDRRLIGDKRIENRENVNARYLSKNDFAKNIEIAVMDVSFISQKLILPSVFSILSEGGELVSLIKPQFEVGRANVGRGGIVKDEKVRLQAVIDVVSFARSIGFQCVAWDISPIKGGDGNTEYLAYFIKPKGENHEKD